MSFYRYFKQNAEAVVIFNEWMKEKTKEWITPFFEAEDFSEVKIIVDVGGNIDILTAVILKANAKMQAILVDREDVVVGANQVLDVAGVLDRCQVVGEKKLTLFAEIPIFTYSLATSLIRDKVILFCREKTLGQILLN
jgi:hypothetical protein